MIIDPILLENITKAYSSGLSVTIFLKNGLPMGKSWFAKIISAAALLKISAVILPLLLPFVVG